MTDNYYDNQPTPSSRPPEPPFRSGSETTQPQARAGTQPLGSSQQTQPQVAYQPDTSGIDATLEVPVGERNETAATFEPARSGDTGRMPQQRQAQHSAPQAAQAPRAAARPAAPATKEKKSGGAGKTFLAGFLGAALACALAGGAFAIWGNTAPRADTTATVLGTSDTSVIDAVEEGQTLAEAVAAKALPSVVAIYNYQDMSNMQGMYGYGFGGSAAGSGELEAAGMGSGVVISDDGYILTNYHVVEDASKLVVTVNGQERDAEFVGGDSSSDVAVLKVSDTSDLVAADIGDSDNLRIGEWVMSVGAPMGLEQSVSTGVVSATNRSTIIDDSATDPYSMYFSNVQPEYTYYPNMIQTDAVINPGNSGGALVDADGKLIGINSVIQSSSGMYAGVGFAIPVNYAMGIAQDIIEGKEPSHAALGVSISQVNEQVARRYNLPVSSGAYISEIVPNSGAANSDLKQGDIITAIDGKTIASVTDVTLDVRGHQVGDTVTVTINRGGETLDVDVVLSSDADLAYGTENESAQQQEQQQPPNTGEEGRNGNGRNNGLSDDELRELLDLLGI